MSYEWLMAPHEIEPNYDAYLTDLASLEEAMANVATYDDRFPDSHIVAEQQGGWRKKFKGSRARVGAWIHTHPDAIDGRAVVHSHLGISFNGEWYGTLEQAKSAALDLA